MIFRLNVLGSGYEELLDLVLLGAVVVAFNIVPHLDRELLDVVVVRFGINMDEEFVLWSPLVLGFGLHF